MMHLIVASLALSLMGGIVKSTHGVVSPGYIMWFRSMIHLMLLAPLLFKNGFKITLKREALMRGLCGSLGMALYYVSLRHLPLAIGNAIFWIAPLFTLVITRIRERQALSMMEHASLAVLTLGIGMICLAQSPSLGESGLSILIIAILSSMSLGASYSYLGLLSKKESVSSIAYSFSYLMFIFFTPYAVMNTPSIMTYSLLLSLVGVAIFASIYQHAIAKAYARYSVEEAARLQSVIIPVASILFDQLLFHHSLSLMTAIGIFLLIASQFLRAYTPQMIFRLAGVVTAILGALFFLPGKAHAFSEKDLQGTFTLVRYYKVVDGKEEEWCKGYFGTLSYFGNRMSVSINCLKQNSNHSVTANPGDMVFYSGSFEVQAPNAIVHHVENSSDPKRIGHDHIRYATFNGDDVVLTGKGVKGDLKITWRRLPGSGILSP